MKKYIIPSVLFILLACSGYPPINNSGKGNNTPPTAYIDGMKLIRQDYNGCVPACLSMMFNFYGRNIDKQEIGNWMQRAYGSSKDDLERYIKNQGFHIYRFSDWKSDKRKIKEFLANGYPILAGGQPGIKREFHMVILIGYDDEKSFFWICDPARGFIRMKYDEFNSFYSTMVGEMATCSLLIYPKK